MIAAFAWIMTEYNQATAADATPGMERVYPLGESGTLEHLLDVSQDAALGARLAAEIFAYNRKLATFFEEVAAERDRFGTRLAILLSREEPAGDSGTAATFRGALFHWRLHLATRIQKGYREIDDRRTNLHIIRMGSNQVLKDYEKAEGRPLSPEAREEVHRQTEAIRATNARIHRLAADAK